MTTYKTSKIFCNVIFDRTRYYHHKWYYFFVANLIFCIYRSVQTDCEILVFSKRIYVIELIQ